MNLATANATRTELLRAVLIVLMGTATAVMTVGCQAGGAAPSPDKVYSQAETLPFEVSFDGQKPVYKPESARRLKVVNGPTAILENPVAFNAVVAVALRSGAPLPTSVHVEVLELDE